MGFSYAYSLKSNEVTLTNCDAEPIHVPGCIQPFGVLIAAEADSLTILQVSDNSLAWLGREPLTLGGLPLSAVIGEDCAALLKTQLAENRIARRPRFVFRFKPADFDLDVLAHIHDGVLILECEDAHLPMAVPREEAYAEVNRITEALRETTGLRDFCQTLALNVRRLTGLDRVMIYRFAEDQSGEVFAEAKRDDLHAYFGLHYPSEDIPQPARDIFRKIWVRPLPSVDYRQSELIPLLNPQTNKPLDMTYCFLRGASVMYTDYLKNMGVAMALTLSIVVDGRLWGLVACHNYAPRVVAWPLRAACELLVQMASLQLAAVVHDEGSVYRERCERLAHGVVEKMIVEQRRLEDLITGPEGLFSYLPADGLALLTEGKWVLHGTTPPAHELNTLADWLRVELDKAPIGTEVLHTHALSERFHAAEPYSDRVSGLVAVPLSRLQDKLIIWFRGELVETVNWAGDPYSKKIVDGPGGERLMPRSSFALWQEKVRGQSAPWTNVEIEAVRRLRISIMEAIAAGAETLSRLNRELTSSNEELDSFAYVTSHDLREPLRGIYHYAYHLKEKAENREDTEGVAKSNSLLRLTKRMDGLIESLLHFSRLGRTSIEREPVDMNLLLDEAADILHASRPAKKLKIKVQSPLPTVQGDMERLRELWLNLLTNAVKYNTNDEPLVEIGVEEYNGVRAFFVRDNGIGIAPENQKTIFQMFKRLHAKDDFGGGSGAGLPIVQRIIDRHEGKIWVKSAVGEGSTFYFTLENGS